jgi:hypothetical protein
VKIEEALNRIISFNNIELSKKAATVLPEQTSNVDSYSASEALGQVEQEVFQALKDITGDLMGGVVKREGDNENAITTGNAGIDAGKVTELSEPQGDILVLLVTQKSEAPENPLKIFVAYKTDEPSAGGVLYKEPAKNGFIDAIVASAKKYIGISMEGPLVPTKDGKGNIASEDEMGYIVRFPDVSHALLKGQVLQSMAAQTVGKGNPWQTLPFVAPEAANVVRVEGNTIEGLFAENTRKEGVKIEDAGVEGKAIDGKALLVLYGSVGNDEEFFKKLSALAVGMGKNIPQESAERPFRVEPPHAIVIRIEPAQDNNKIVPISPDELSVQEFQGRAGQAIESVENDVMNEALSVTAFGGQEISKSPITNNSMTNTNIPITNNFNPPVDNDVVFKRLALFVDRVNVLLDGETVVDEIPVNAPSDGDTESMSGRLNLLRLQTRDAGTGPIVQAAVKKIIFANEEFQKAQVIGLSIGKNNLLQLDASTFEGAFASNEEETLNTLKGLGNSLYERINYFVHPYAGIYADNKEVLQLRASQKDESALLLDKQLNKEQGGLEKRLNELQLLIERSTLVKQWFAEDNAPQAEDST